MTRPLAAYNASQPPRTASRVAMPDRVSPGCTTYPAAGRVAATNTAATLTAAASVTSVVLLAVRMFAEAGRTDPVMPAATRTTKMLQANTAHADFKHACTYVPFLPRGIQRPNAAGPDAKNGPIGRKGLKLAAPPAGRNARSASRRHDVPAGAQAR